MRGVRVKCQVWKGCGWPPPCLHAHTCGPREAGEGSLDEFSASHYPLDFSPRPPSLAPRPPLSVSLSPCHSPSFTLSIFHQLHPNYSCHFKLNCCNRIAAFPLKSADCCQRWWKWRLFPSANFQVCVMGGKEESAGWLPPLLWNVSHQRLREALKWGLLAVVFQTFPSSVSPCEFPACASQAHFLFISSPRCCSEFLL